MFNHRMDKSQDTRGVALLHQNSQRKIVDPSEIRHGVLVALCCGEAYSCTAFPSSCGSTSSPWRHVQASTNCACASLDRSVVNGEQRGAARNADSHVRLVQGLSGCCSGGGGGSSSSYLPSRRSIVRIRRSENPLDPHHANFAVLHSVSLLTMPKPT